MPDLITKAKALELLEAAVAERGADYVYERIGFDSNSTGPSCVYVRSGCPSCLVGLAMTKAGTPIEQLAEWDTRFECDAQSVLLDDGLATAGAAEVLTVAQSVQDDGGTWGEALDAAKELAAATVEGD